MLPTASSSIPRPRRRLVLALLLPAALLVATPARAEERERPPVEAWDLWSEPHPGVRYLRRVTTAPCTVHVLAIDLAEEGVALELTPHADRWETVRTLAEEEGFEAAVNGGFWESFSRPGGLHVSAGEAWPETHDDGHYGFFAVRERRGRRRALISPPEAFVDPPPTDLALATSGRPMLVRDGELDVLAIDPVESANRRQPRTAVGVSADGRRVWLAVTDGRQEHSKGMTLYELGRLLAELGAADALNLDGGGSSTLFVERLGGVINAPSGSRWEEALGFGVERVEGEETGRRRRTRDGREMVYVRGVEREVMNVLGVRARAPEAATEPPRAPPPLTLPAEVPEVVTLPPRAPPVSLGRLREWLRPVGWGLGTLLVVTITVKRAYRRRRFQS